MLEGRVADVQAAGFIVALRTKGETDEELAALVRAMHRYATHVDVPDGAIDTCGTGGDRSGTVNVSTMAALDRGGRGCEGREARQPGAVVAVRFGRRARGARRRDRARPRRRRPLRAGSRRRLLSRAAIPPRDAIPRPGPQGARRADDVQLSRAAGEPGARAPPGRRRERRDDGDEDAGHARRRSVPSGRWCSTATTGSTRSRRRRRAAVHELVDGERRRSTFDPLDFGIARDRTRAARRWRRAHERPGNPRGARRREGRVPRHRARERGGRAHRGGNGARIRRGARSRGRVGRRRRCGATHSMHWSA